MKANTARAAWGLAALALIVSCSSSSEQGPVATDGGGGSDAADATSAADGQGSSGDSATMDAPSAPADAVSPDSTAPDAAAPDAMAPDAVAPDAVAPDAMAPDSAASDAGAQEASTGFVFAPDGGACQALGDSCTTCAEASNCSSAYCTCYGDPDCASVLTCLDECGGQFDSPCEYDCYAGHSTGISEALVLGDCSARQCPSQCPGVQAIPECWQWLASMAASDFDACLVDPTCVAWFDCYEECGSDGVCIENCAADPTAESLLGDTQDVCTNYCM